MSWYDSSWNERIAITVNNTTATGSYDVTIDLANYKHLSNFWTNTLASGNDIRVTSADGRTLVVYDVTSFNRTNKTGTLKMQAVSLTTGVLNVFWLYWNNSGASAANTPFGAASPKTGVIWPGRPVGPWTVVARMPQPGDTVARPKIAKAPNDAGWLMLNVGEFLVQAGNTSNGSKRFDEVATVTATMYTGVTNYTATGIDLTKSKVTEDWVLIWVQAGVTATDYTVYTTITTAEGLTWQIATFFSVKLTAEA
jgi:hypothetical protein